MKSCVNCKHEGLCDKIRKVYCQCKKYYLWEPKITIKSNARLDWLKQEATDG